MTNYETAARMAIIPQCRLLSDSRQRDHHHLKCNHQLGNNQLSLLDNTCRLMLKVSGNNQFSLLHNTCRPMLRCARLRPCWVGCTHAWQSMWSSSGKLALRLWTKSLQGCVPPWHSCRTPTQAGVCCMAGVFMRAGCQALKMLCRGRCLLHSRSSAVLRLGVKAHTAL